MKLGHKYFTITPLSYPGATVDTNRFSMTILWRQRSRNSYSMFYVQPSDVMLVDFFYDNLCKFSFLYLEFMCFVCIIIMLDIKQVDFADIVKIFCPLLCFCTIFIYLCSIELFHLLQCLRLDSRYVYNTVFWLDIVWLK